MEGIMLRLALALATALAVSLMAAPMAAASPYKQMVDNASPRFSASSNWQGSSWSDQKVGKNYRYARPKAVRDNAWFKVKVPKTKRYRVFARWPATSGYNTSTAFGVRTTDGLKVRRVNQTKNGGRWVRLGTFRLKAGDSRRIFVSRRSKGKGYIIADAVFVREVQAKTQTLTRRQKVIREARGWLGVPYRYGGASRRGVDCSGLTMRVFERANMSLPRTAASQYRRGRATRSPRVSDLAFGDYNNDGRISHVGIYSGKGKMINAPYPGIVVRYDPIQPRYHVGYRKLLG
jgi:cell wall-associated NlpC family hydrolase